MWTFLSVLVICLTILIAMIIHYAMNPEASTNGRKAASVPDWDLKPSHPIDGTSSTGIDLNVKDPDGTQRFYH